eukprot:5837095-Pleurochrysis_carterae.AAC.4
MSSVAEEASLQRHKYCVLDILMSSSVKFSNDRQKAICCVSQRDCTFGLFLAKAKGIFRKTKQGGGASMRRSLCGSKTKTQR